MSEEGNKRIADVRAAIAEAFADDPWAGITVNVCEVVTFGNSPKAEWGARIERPRKTASGRKGKPEKIITVLGPSAGKVLHDVAVILGYEDTSDDA